MLKMMLAKEMVQREDGPRGYLWTAQVSRKAAISGLLGKLVQHVFDGSARRLVTHLIEEGELDDREGDEILEILKSQQEKDKKPSPKRRGPTHELDRVGRLACMDGGGLDNVAHGLGRRGYRTYGRSLAGSSSSVRPETRYGVALTCC